MIEPYFETKLGKLYCGDCIEIMKEIHDNSIDLLLTDPPYPGIKGNMPRNFKGGVAQRDTIEKSVGQLWDSSLNWLPDAWKKINYGAFIFCSFHSVAEIKMILPKAHCMALITWYKRNSPPTGANTPRYTTEYIWAFKKNIGLNWGKLKTTMIDIPLLQSGCMATERLVINNKTVHPAQKPLSLIRELLYVGGTMILDPFIGTGTTAIACEQFKKKWIGIELNKDYCAIPKNRIMRETRQRCII